MDDAESPAVGRTIPAMDLLDLLCDLIGATPFVALCVEAVNRGIARGVMHGDVPESVDSVGWCTEKGETIPGGDALLRRRGTS